MKAILKTLSLVIAFQVAVQIGIAQAPAGAPAGATGLCNDGTYATSASKSAGCRGHKGVKDWYVSAAPAPAAPTPAAPTPAAPTAKPSASQALASANAMTAMAPGGGAGKVWVNTASNVYHCQDDRYYGKTKAGQYMSEADAKAKGARPDHGKSCQ